MKATIFLKPLEYNFEAVGEKWLQGDKIKGSLKIKNHSAEKIEFPILTTTLSEGNYKKIKAKDDKGWKQLHKIVLDEKISLNGPEEVEYPFEFSLPEDCLITDKNSSLYLTFFDREDSWPAGHIELIVAPKLVVTQVLEVIENFLRFKVVQIKSNKAMIEVKLNPPNSREFSSIESVMLNLSEVDKNLTIDYLFSVRSIDMSSGTMQTQKKIKEIKQKFNSKQYLIYGQSLNQDFILESVNSALNEVKLKLL